MPKERPLWYKLYFDEVYTEIARIIGYRGTTYRTMMKALEPLESRFGKQRVQSAAYHIVTYEGQMTCNPKPLASVNLRPDVRRLCWQLLGPPPEYKCSDRTNNCKERTGSRVASRGKNCGQARGRAKKSRS
jgi:hypothetical protein